jgi:hypothetical protein
MSYTAKDLNPLVRGDDWTIKLVVSSDGSIVDVNGYTYTFTLKGNIDDPDPGDLQVSSNPTGLDATSGIVYINAPKASTGILDAKTYNYDIQQIDDTGSIQTLLLGKVKVVKDVTRSTS